MVGKVNFNAFKKLDFNTFKFFNVIIKYNYFEIKGVTVHQNIILEKKEKNINFLNSYIDLLGESFELDYQSKLILFNLKEADLIKIFKEQCEQIEVAIKELDKKTPLLFLTINKNNLICHNTDGRKFYLY